MEGKFDKFGKKFKQKREFLGNLQRIHGFFSFFGVAEANSGQSMDCHASRVALARNDEFLARG